MSNPFRGIAHGLLAVGFVIGLHGAAFGATAGTGTFDIDTHGAPPNVTFDGTLTFGNDPRMVGGTPVNLGTSVGAIPYDGSAVINVQALSATFDLTASEAGFAFTGEGSGACTGGCINGTATFVGEVTSLTDPSTFLPSGFAYTFDGSIFIDFLGNGPGGTFALNAFADVATPSGSNVIVTSGLDSYFDSRTETLRDFFTELVFTSITNAGVTNFFGVTLLPGTLPNGITLIPNASVFIDVQTSATFTGPVDVCVAYDDDSPADGIVDGTTVSVDQLVLLHALATGQAFTDVTTTVGNGKVCGQVTSLSPFVVAAGPPPTTTSSSTTTVPTTTILPTTTTTLPELLPGKKLLLKDKTGKPQKRGLDCLAKTAITLGDGNSSGDDPTLNGGSVRVRGATFDNTYELSKSGWKYQGKAGQGKGYKFKGTTIKSVLVKNGKLLRVLGKGSSLGHSLATDPKPVSVTLTLGARKYCLAFAAGDFKEGTKFLAKDAPKPAECGSPSGAFVD